MSSGSWLADELSTALISVPGSHERDQIIGMLARAVRLRLASAVTRAAALTAIQAPATVERHLNKLVIRDEVLWVEYNHADRIPIGADTNGIGRVGALIAVNPAYPGHAAVFTAWDRGGSVHHSYALLHWNLTAIAEASKSAPKTDDGCSGERMMAAASISVPPGLLTEMEVWQETGPAGSPRHEAVLLQTQKDAAGENLFLLSALLLCETGSTSIENAADCPDSDGGAPLRLEALFSGGSLRPPWLKGGFHTFMGRLLWSIPEGATTASLPVSDLSAAVDLPKGQG